MYDVIEAIGTRRGLNKRWELIDLNSFTVAQLFTTFRRTQLKLIVSGVQGTFYYLDLATLASRYQMFTGSVQDMLIDNGNTTLEVTNTGWKLENKTAEFSDAYRAGYKAEPVTSYNVLVEPAKARTVSNLRLTNEVKDVDYNLFYKACLVTVCGYIHRIDTDGINGVMVVDAMRTCLHSGENQIGLLSFADVCELKQVPLTAGMIDTSVSGRATVTFAEDTSNYTVALVLAGYLVQVDDAALSQVSGFSYTIDFTRLNIVDKYHEADAYLDLTNLDLGAAAANPDQISVEDLTSPETIAKWLTLSQSFFVFFKHSDIYFERKAVRQTGLPSRYIAYAEPFSLLQLDTGRMPSYWKKADDIRWAINIYDSTVSNRAYDNAQGTEWQTSAGNEHAGYPGKISGAGLLEIGRDIV